MKCTGILTTTALALTLFTASLRAGLDAPTITDDYATESTVRWNFRHVPDLTVSTDAREGQHSLVGTYAFTQHIVLPAGKTPWNLTGWTRLCFWAKAEAPNNNLLVMLSTKDYDNRRDTAVSLGTEWKYYELALTEQQFSKNVQGDADLRKVQSIILYNNEGKPKEGMKIWIDGLKLTGPKQSQVRKPAQPQLPLDGGLNVLKMTDIDPFPHKEDAERTKTQLSPRYDPPPVSFNKINSFENALINFDKASGWKAVVRDGNGFLCRSMDQTLRGVPNLKVEVVPTGEKTRIQLIPPEPIAVPQAFDLVEAWAYSGKAGGSISFEFERKNGSTLTVGSDYSDTADDVNPKPMGQFWVLARVKLPGAVEAGAKLKSITLTPTPSKRFEDPTFLFHMDQIRVQLFSDIIKQPPPQFPHVGKVVDNFPVTPDGACPRTQEPVVTKVVRSGKEYHFTYTTQSGEQVRYVYTPETGTFADIRIHPQDDTPFQPAADSGPVFNFDGATYDAPAGNGGEARLASQELSGDALTVVWEYSGANDKETIAYTFTMKGKTLCVSASSEERYLNKWFFGEARGVKNARIIEVPFMNYCPNTLLTHNLFVTYYHDWYVSNVSMFPYGAKNSIKGDVAGYNWRDRRGNPNGGYVYLKRTDGQRLPFRERFYITASSTYDDVMLTVNNPPSPMKSVLKRYLFRMISSSEKGIFARTRKLADLCDQYGMRNVYMLFHAPLFFRRHMGAESFPGDRDVAFHHAPEGGNAGLKTLFDRMSAIGMRPGYYDSYPARDFTSNWFRYDWLKFQSDGQWDKGWRCAIQKPWAFPEIAATLQKERAATFGARVGYQDGVTSWVITYMTDLDHRWPESGTLRETLRAYATGWQRSRENVNGPAFAEGRGSDFFVAGLNDGNYGKLRGYWDDKDCTQDRAKLFVDFRLKQTGPLNAPMGLDIAYAGFAPDNKINFYRFYSKTDFKYLHHYMVAQMAFAVIPMFEPYWCVWDDPHHQFTHSMTCYFMMQQLMERYIMEEVESIRYFDGKTLLSTSDALRADVVKDNLLTIRYRNGLELWLNMNWDDKPWTVNVAGRDYPLPPGGWVARQGDEFLEYSALVGGNRVDYVDSPEYTYLNGFGQTAREKDVETDRQMIVWKRGPHAGKTLYYPAQ